MPLNTDRPPGAPLVQDEAMLALIERVVHLHREAAQHHERAGRRQQALREYETVGRIERYLCEHQARRKLQP